ncbi:MAG TPA: TIM-barrel domain-containing protein [Bellilinea sp.]|nr:TIM-barrel domain-containing protein [Bellilinea sp.]
MPEHSFFVPSAELALANPEVVFTFPQVRFSLLTSHLIRIEASPDGTFEDRPTQQFWYRRQPVPQAKIAFGQHSLTIETDVFSLKYQDLPAGLTPAALQVTVRETGLIFHLDDANPAQLPGTTRTLDGTNGPVRLSPGFISRSGWVQLDDTSSLVFNSDGWLEPRPAKPGYRDLYLLICGWDYKSALQDYQAVSGKPSLLPRAFLGNWWSRFWEYSQADVEQLVERFQEAEIPLSVFIIDMDWHITQTGNTSGGWTGFSWNRDLFPDPPGLLAGLHQRNLLTSLNLHPADGIHPHEDQYPAAARALGLDPARKYPIPFDIASQDFARVYFDLLLHPLEDMGVDFWWVDWQQEQHTALKGLDPLWWLNHLHYYDLVRGGALKRPVIFSRWGGAGNQRYPIGFSGDTIVSWKSLAYQPFFTASAANVAYGWWSHDIGGHMFGMEDKELYTRWVQFGVVSPILRLHATKNPFIERVPWAYDAETFKLIGTAMRFRHALVPYLYTMARRNEVEGLPLITPLYYEYPNEDSAYQASSQYRFGNQLMAAPVVTPLDPDLNLSRQVIWFPPGTWFNFFSGERILGGQWKVVYSGLEEIPLFARAGAIVPLAAETGENGTANPAALDLVVFPGADGHFSLYEDDGVSQEYQISGGCRTAFDSIWDGNKLTVTIVPAEGDTSVIPPTRSYRILLRGVGRPASVQVHLNVGELESVFGYDEITRTVMVNALPMGVHQTLRMEVDGIAPLDAQAELKAAILRILRRARMGTDAKWQINARLDQLLIDDSVLNDPSLKLKPSHILALKEMIGKQ